MRKKGRIYQLAITLLLCFLQTAGIAMYGQDRPRAASKRAQRHQTDTLNTVVNRDSLAVADSLAAENKRKMLETNLQPQVLETAHLLWRICRLCLCTHVEQQDVQGLFGRLQGCRKW